MGPDSKILSRLRTLCLNWESVDNHTCIPYSDLLQGNFLKINFSVSVPPSNSLPFQTLNPDIYSSVSKLATKVFLWKAWCYSREYPSPLTQETESIPSFSPINILSQPSIPTQQKEASDDSKECLPESSRWCKNEAALSAYSFPSWKVHFQVPQAEPDLLILRIFPLLHDFRQHRGDLSSSRVFSQ